MVFALAHVDDVAGYVGRNHEQRMGVPAYGESAALAYRVELRPLVPADDSPVGVGLVSGFLDVVLAGAVDLRLEADVAVVKRS